MNTNNLYYNTSMHDFGLFLRKIIDDFLDGKEPSYGLHYTKNYGAMIRYRGKTLIFFVPQYRTSLLQIIPPDHIIINNDSLIFDPTDCVEFKKRTKKELQEDRFALSTVLSEEQLSTLELGSYFLDLTIDGFFMVLDIRFLFQYYNRINSSYTHYNAVKGI